MLHNLQGGILARQGKLQEAIPCYEKALELEPGFPEALKNLAIAYLADSEWEQAASLANTCKELAGSLLQRNDSNVFWKTGIDWTCRHTLALVALQLGQLTQARDEVNAYFPELMEMYEDDESDRELDLVLANSALLLGDVAVANGNQNEAVTYWQQVSTVLDGETESLAPKSIVTLIKALQRLDENERSQALVAYLQDAGYRHPAFLRVLEDR